MAFIKKQISDVKNFGIRELFRKLYLLFKTLAVILVNILAIVPSIIIRLISPWIIIRIHAASCGNFGNFVYGLALYYCKKKLNINQQAKKHHIDLFYISYKDRKIYNRQLAKMWKRKLIFLPYYLLAPINTINRFIEILHHNQRHYQTLVRWSKGTDIDAACGQLSTKSK